MLIVHEVYHKALSWVLYYLDYSILKSSLTKIVSLNELIQKDVDVVEDVVSTNVL